MEWWALSKRLQRALFKVSNIWKIVMPLGIIFIFYYLAYKEPQNSDNDDTTNRKSSQLASNSPLDVVSLNSTQNRERVKLRIRTVEKLNL